MFTGIVSEVGEVTALESLKGGVQLSVQCSFAADTHIDESIAVTAYALRLSLLMMRHSRFNALKRRFVKRRSNHLKLGVL